MFDSTIGLEITEPATVADVSADPVATLLPCPFCGSVSTDVIAVDCGGQHESRPQSWGKCLDCGAVGAAHTLVEDAADAWNARAGGTAHENRLYGIVERGNKKLRAARADAARLQQCLDEQFSEMVAAQAHAMMLEAGSDA